MRGSRFRSLAALCVALAVTLVTAVPASASVAFDPYQAYSVGSWPSSVAIADVTGDGRNDVVLSTGYYFDAANDFKLFVFAQQADGSLATPVKLATDGVYGDPMGLAAADLNGDGRTDIVLAVTGGLDVYYQQPGGGLGSPALIATPSQAFHAVPADLNGDGKQDLVVSTRNGVLAITQQVVHKKTTFVVQTITTDPQWEVEVGDLTGDGKPDVAGCSGLNDCGAAVNVFKQNRNKKGALSWTESTYPAVTGYYPTACGLGIGDLTGDGRADVALSICGNSPGALVNVFAQTPSGGLGSPTVYNSYDIPEPITIADIDGDGRADLVTLHGGWNDAGVYLQQSSGTLGSEALYAIPYASHYEPKGVAVGDVNSDGKPDIVLADYNNGLIVLRRQ